MFPLFRTTIGQQIQHHGREWHIKEVAVLLATLPVANLRTHCGCAPDGMTKKQTLNCVCFLVAFPAGVEPTAYRLGGDRSILLSYGNVLSKNKIVTIIQFFIGFVKGARRIRSGQNEVMPRISIMISDLFIIRK